MRHTLSPGAIRLCISGRYNCCLPKNIHTAKSRQTCNVLNYILKMWKLVKIYFCSTDIV